MARTTVHLHRENKAVHRKEEYFRKTNSRVLRYLILLFTTRPPDLNQTHYRTEVNSQQLNMPVVTLTATEGLASWSQERLRHGWHEGNGERKTRLKSRTLTAGRRDTRHNPGPSWSSFRCKNTPGKQEHELGTG